MAGRHNKKSSLKDLFLGLKRRDPGHIDDDDIANDDFPDTDELPKWNLDWLYPGLDSEELAADIEEITAEVSAFKKEYEGTVFYMKGKDLGEAIAAYEELCERIGRISCYLELLESEHIDNYKTTRAVREWVNTAGDAVAFFEGEINTLKETDLLAKMSAPELSKYAPWLAGVRGDRKHTLDDELEGWSGEMYRAAQEPWAILYNQTLEEMDFTLGGETVKMRDIESAVYSSDKTERAEARKEAGRVLKQYSGRMAHIYNTQIKDKLTEDKWRGYPRPDTDANKRNRVEDETIDTMFDTIKESYKDLSHRYYKWLAKQHGKTRLKTADLPDKIPGLGDASHEGMEWDEARKTILRAYRHFSPKMERIGRKFFTDGYIDAEPRAGKYAGSFAMATGPDSHPFIHIHFTGALDDVVTLGHELGHGIHQVLAEKAQGSFLSEMSEAASETASIFGEMLVFEELIKQEKDPDVQQELLRQQTLGMIQNGLQQLAYYDFERRVFEARKKGELDAEQISDIWVATQQEYYGPAVEMDDYDRYYWTTVPHFFETPFYVYSYAFAQVMVSALYQAYEECADDEERKDFTDKYIELLETGISKTFFETMEPFGFDPETPEFWKKGLSHIEKYLDCLESFTDPDLAKDPEIAGFIEDMGLTINPTDFGNIKRLKKSPPGGPKF